MKIEIEHISDTRVILTFGNGFSLDVDIVGDGISAQLFRDQTLMTELSQDWDEPHMNE